MITPKRHLSLAGFRDYLSSGVSIAHPIDGEPPLLLIIDPHVPALTLRGPLQDGVAVPSINTENISVSKWARGPNQLQLVITDAELFLDAYPLLCAIADRVQLGGHDFAAAIAETVKSLRSLLQRGRTLSRHRELGLCGELLVLLGACRHLGPDEAIAGWRGPHSEEHDFSVAGMDVEVKTTATERRAHWIDSLTQLDANEGTSLWVVSHQLTEAGPHDGWRLPDLVDAARQAFAGTSALTALNDRLSAAGWSQPFAEMCITRWRRRSPSKAFRVTGGFPRLTSAQLTQLDYDRSRLVAVSYRIDLSAQRPGDVVPALLSDIMATEVTL
ncbi:Putative PD-(D/E)XK family member [Asanoa hainanensis]|uniref:Putative PD-(D/E)XK family member n=1 Tax=Asanoa hainanensis TaxID=560556 RepID=A0A239MTK8_9ACTN|nr:PD-(D/E)XK motif protein [Asanoa hainanensis]SNT45820.1 Putative PD-(D/E)XK family member [Asanoa hainanensis]